MKPFQKFAQYWKLESKGSKTWLSIVKETKEEWKEKVDEWSTLTPIKSKIDSNVKENLKIVIQEPK